MAKGPKVNPSTMLWFIRSRSYMPIHEIRRRFMIDSDEASVVYDQSGPVYIGLPQKPASVLMELTKQNKIGLECSVDFDARVLIGVFPMQPAREESTVRPRPVQRPAAPALRHEATPPPGEPPRPAANGPTHHRPVARPHHVGPTNGARPPAPVPPPAPAPPIANETVAGPPAAPSHARPVANGPRTAPGGQPAPARPAPRPTPAPIRPPTARSLDQPTD